MSLNAGGFDEIMLTDISSLTNKYDFSSVDSDLVSKKKESLF
ncbi:MAG: hypothetical protein AAF208_11080 [Cyanobacteria bacterium P01_A01_bin.45]